MKINIDSRSLVDALKITSRASRICHIEAQVEGIIVTASSVTATISVGPIPCDIDSLEEGWFLTNSSRIISAVSCLNSKTITITSVDSGVNISAGGGLFHIAKIQYRVSPTAHLNCIHAVEVIDFSDGISSALSSIDPRIDQCSFCVIKNGQIIYSTDRRRISKYSLLCKENKSINALIEYKDIETIKSLLSHKPGELCKISSNDKAFTIETESVKATFSQANKEVHNFEETIKSLLSDDGCIVSVKKDEVKYACKMMKSVENATTINIHTEITVSDRGVLFKKQSDKERSEYFINEGQKSSGRFLINEDFLLGMIENSRQQLDICIKFTKATASIVEEGYTGIVALMHDVETQKPNPKEPKKTKRSFNP